MEINNAVGRYTAAIDGDMVMVRRGGCITAFRPVHTEKGPAWAIDNLVDDGRDVTAVNGRIVYFSRPDGDSDSEWAYGSRSSDEIRAALGLSPYAAPGDDSAGDDEISLDGGDVSGGGA